jgi:uncharacterized protein (DUF1499 family)
MLFEMAFGMTRKPEVRTAAALPLLAVLVLTGCTSIPDKPVTVDVLPDCGWLPNCVNTQSGRGVQNSEPIGADAGQWRELKSWLAGQEDWEITTEETNFIQAVVKTPLMRFRDDVQLLYLPDEMLIQVRSSSRLGISDLGTNARRVQTLREIIAR